MSLRDDVFREYILNITVIFNIGSDVKNPYIFNRDTLKFQPFSSSFKFVLMSTVQFKFFQCRAASLLKIELQAYEIIVTGTFF